MEKNQKLIDLARSGSCDAFCRLYERHRDSLYRYALYRLGSPEDAEDAVQECVLSAWRQIRGLRSTEAFKTWIFRILAGCCSRMIRGSIRHREKLEMVKSSTAPADAAATPETSVQVRSGLSVDSMVLQDALDQLDPESRDIVLLTVVGGFTSSEVSALVGIRPGSVRSRLSRSLGKMRLYLES